MQAVPVSRAAMDAKHASRHKGRKPPAQLAARNLRPVLDLGNTAYFNFRGRAYGVPPLPWHPGVQLQQIWVEACACPSPLTPASATRYHALLAQLPSLLWRHTRPVGRIRRLLRRLGLHRNPFATATEQELVELAGFFLQRRIRSSIGYQPGPAIPSPST